MTLFGGIIKVLGTVIPGIPPTTQFWITFCGQLLNSLGHPVVITMSTKVSQTWFGQRERPLTTTCLGLAPTLGGLLGRHS